MRQIPQLLINLSTSYKTTLFCESVRVLANRRDFHASLVIVVLVGEVVRYQANLVLVHPFHWILIFENLVVSRSGSSLINVLCDHEEVPEVVLHTASVDYQPSTRVGELAFVENREFVVDSFGDENEDQIRGGVRVSFFKHFLNWNDFFFFYHFSLLLANTVTVE